MTETVSLVISIIALILSTVTTWLTLFRRGTVKMTQPTVIFFGHDSSRTASPRTASPKIFLRSLLFSTSQRGRVIESMYVTLLHNNVLHAFNIWVYGDDKLSRGSGLFIGETGVAANHHFLISAESSQFRFSEGEYQLEVFVRLYGARKQRLLFAYTLSISSEQAKQLSDTDTGLYFDWMPNQAQYLPKIDKRVIPPSSEEFLKHLLS